jgi:hypothetical protein
MDWCEQQVVRRCSALHGFLHRDDVSGSLHAAVCAVAVVWAHCICCTVATHMLELNRCAGHMHGDVGNIIRLLACMVGMFWNVQMVLSYAMHGVTYALPT